MTTKPEMITKTAVKDMGFTETMITKLLPEPITKENPRYRSAAPMKLWYEQDVLKVMETDEYKAMLVQAKKRKASAAKAVATKTQTLYDEIMGYSDRLSIKIISDEDLMRKTIAAKKGWYANRDFYASQVYVDSVDDQTMNRWVVNYIRHNLTFYEHTCNAYDYIVDKMSGRVGVTEVYRVLKNYVLDKAAVAYPKYAEECQRQKLSIGFD